MKKAFITGVTGQDGAYLANFLLEQNYKVFGGVRRSSQDELYRLKQLKIVDKIKFFDFESTDQFAVFDLIRENQFDEIYNLAAQSFVGASWNLSVPTTNVNSLGVLFLLEAIKRFSPDTKFYQASTSEMFGKIQTPVQTETTPFYPRSPYGVSKLFSHWMTINYRESFGLRACCGILFNHESPLRGQEFVTKKITSQLCEIKSGEREKLQLGNLDASRDWGYAKEYVEAMWLMLQQEELQEYVIATNKSTTVRQFVTLACQSLNMEVTWQGSGENEIGLDKKSGKVIVEVSPKFFRPAEVDVLIGSYDKAKQNLGWEPKTNLEKLAKIMVDFDSKKGVLSL